MYAQVVRLWIDGKQVPRWRLSQLAGVTGELRLQQSHDEHLNRHLRSAHLFDSDKPHNERKGDAIPPLIDAAILCLTDRRMTISGFERNEMMTTYAQTWLVEIISLEVPACA